MSSSPSSGCSSFAPSRDPPRDGNHRHRRSPFLPFIPLPWPPRNGRDGGDQRLGFSFFLAGIAAVIFEAVFGQHYRIGHHARLSLKNSTERWFLRLMLMAIVWAWLSIILLLVMGTDALQSLGAAGLVIGSYMIASRHDLLWNALWSGLLMAIVFSLSTSSPLSPACPQLPNFPDLHPGRCRHLGHYLGLVFGPMYEFVRGFRLRH